MSRLTVARLFWTAAYLLFAVLSYGLVGPLSLLLDAVLLVVIIKAFPLLAVPFYRYAFRFVSAEEGGYVGIGMRKAASVITQCDSWKEIGDMVCDALWCHLGKTVDDEVLVLVGDGTPWRYRILLIRCLGGKECRD